MRASRPKSAYQAFIQVACLSGQVELEESHSKRTPAEAVGSESPQVARTRASVLAIQNQCKQDAGNRASP